MGPVVFEIAFVGAVGFIIVDFMEDVQEALEPGLFELFVGVCD